MSAPPARGQAVAEALRPSLGGEEPHDNTGQWYGVGLEEDRIRGPWKGIPSRRNRESEGTGLQKRGDPPSGGRREAADGHSPPGQLYPIAPGSRAYCPPSRWLSSCQTYRKQQQRGQGQPQALTLGHAAQPHTFPFGGRTPQPRCPIQRPRSQEVLGVTPSHSTPSSLVCFCFVPL